MNPIKSFFKNFFARKRVLGDSEQLTGLAKADALLNTLVNEGRVPGISVTVLKNGETLLKRGYGYADMERQEPVHTEKTIFRIASVSKPIAATALAHMVGEGLIDLDASFYRYVPDYPKKKYDFTIRQLAGHTAGIRGYRGAEYGLNEPFSIGEGAAIFKEDPLMFEPGTQYLYNSYDWVLIALAMEEASGIAFEEYVHNKVLVPLGMQATFAPENYKGTSGTTHGNLGSLKEHNERGLTPTSFYSKNRIGFRKAIPVNNYYKLAGGGYLSTSEDIAKLGQAYLEGKVLTPALIEPFLTSQRIADVPTYYGLGWQVSQDKKGRSFYGHVGNGVGGYSNFFVYPENQMVIAILINCTDPKVQDTLDAVIDGVIRAVETTTA